MKDTMKEVVIIGPKQYEIREVPVPAPGNNEVLVQMKAAGVCGSDIHQFLGENPNTMFSRIPGHENVGIVVVCGADVKNIKVGDHVVVDLVVACGECPQCKKGRRNVCRTVKARGAAIDGGWREYFAVPEHEVYLLPQDMPFKDAALIEPFAIGGHCTTRAGIQGGESVLVLGSGTIGAVILQTLKLKGCRVICADINDDSLARAQKYGADAVVNTKKENLKDAVQKFTDGAGVDVIFDSACYPGSLTAVLEMGIPANGATVVPMGFCTAQEGITQDMINTRELSIIGTRMSCNQFQPTIERFAKHEYQLDGMVSHYIPFSQVGQVFENIIHPPKNMKKMVIVFDEE